MINKLKLLGKRVLETGTNFRLKKSFEDLRNHLEEYNSSQNDALTKRPIIIVFANYSYLEILLNWIKSIQSLNLSNYLVISMDSKIYNVLLNKRIRTVLIETDRNLKDIWKIRIKIFRFLVDNGYDFIHSDADAIWLRNPFPEYFDSHPELDLILSQGTVFPKNVFKRWGFVLCCGLFFVRTNQRTSKIFKEVETDTIETCDDQKSLNAILINKDINWSSQEQYHIPFRNCSVTCSGTLIQGEGNDIRVGVLPFKRFPRLSQYQENPYVIHPLTRKNASEKKEEFKELGLWFLP